MAAHVDAQNIERYRERAQLLRSAAEHMSTAEGRLHLLRIADEFEQMADSMERARLG